MKKKSSPNLLFLWTLYPTNHGTLFIILETAFSSDFILFFMNHGNQKNVMRLATIRTQRP